MQEKTKTNSSLPDYSFIPKQYWKILQEQSYKEIAKTKYFGVPTSIVPILEKRDRINSSEYQWPLAKNEVTSEFGYRTDAVPNQHDGLDLRTKKGTPVYAMADGKVSLADLEYSGSASKSSYLIIDGTDGYQQRYLHMDSFTVEKGNKIKKGQLLGYSGDKKDMPEHLHIEIRKGSEKIDPRTVLPEL